jgi:uncharacterized membrane protein YfcA
MLAPQLAAPLIVFGALLADLLAVRTLRRGFELGRILPFLLAGLPGIPIGIVLLKNADQTAFRLGVGLVLLVYAAAMLLLGRAGPLKGGGRLADAAVGFFGGLLGGAAGLSAPAPAVWAALRGWKSDVQRAVRHSLGLAMHGAIFAFYAASGLVIGHTAWMLALVVPAAVVPTLIGARLSSRLDATVTTRVVLVLTGLSGLGLIAAAVRHVAVALR